MANCAPSDGRSCSDDACSPRGFQFSGVCELHEKSHAALAPHWWALQLSARKRELQLSGDEMREICDLVRRGDGVEAELWRHRCAGTRMSETHFMEVGAGSIS